MLKQDQWDVKTKSLGNQALFTLLYMAQAGLLAAFIVVLGEKKTTTTTKNGSAVPP